MSATPVAPRATYRLQLRGDVGFREAADLVPYLAELGASHLYASPCALARAGSDHGYDVVDPRRLDPALGDEADFDALVAALRRSGMGLILDWVPNHVGIAAGQNPWWQEVLAFGPVSPYADFFDVDWEPGRPELRGKVLLPVLGRPYGAALEAGELVPEREGGGLVVHYFEHRFPVGPATWARWLGRALGPEADLPPALREALEGMARRAGRRAERVRRALAAQEALGAELDRDAAWRARVDAAVASLRGELGRPASFDPLHRLLEAQAWRLAWWRVASDEINYRRFFDINDLAAVRMERREVFDHVHETVFAWIEAGRVDGLRIDHVDGLADPGGYCARLRERFPAERLYLVVEKILGAGEALPEGWPVDGTTGYEFASELNGLFVDPRGEAPLDRLHRDVTGETRPFDAVLRASKHRVLRALLASELDGLASALDRLAQADRHTRDFTARGLREALRDVVVAFPVYRSYVGEGGASAADRAHVAAAVAEARARGEDPGAGLWDWIEHVLTGDLARSLRPGRRRRAARSVVTRFEQLTAPAMAKGLEDTAFYRHHRLVALNEVGGDPRRFGVDPAAFHAAARERARRHPRAMLSTSTHDTKRGEDVRARLDVLSERPDDWARTVREWMGLHRGARRSLAGGPAPAPKDEYLLYQVLVGSFPVEPPEPDVLAAYRERVQAYLVKALREGKERSSWRHPDEAYERAVLDFAGALLEPRSAFLEAFLPFQAEVAAQGAVNGLAQVAVKLTAPGVPDVYQGCEGWDLSLADPDNRRPVDFASRRRALETLRAGMDEGDVVRSDALRALREGWRDGRIKQLVTWRLLAFRARRPELFVGAGYAPLVAAGERASHLCAFARTRAGVGDALVVVAPRLCAALPRDEGPFPLGRTAWGRTRVALAGASDAVVWRDVVSGRRVRAGDDGDGRGLAVADLFAELPLAVLVPDRREGGGAPAA